VWTKKTITLGEVSGLRVGCRRVGSHQCHALPPSGGSFAEIFSLHLPLLFPQRPSKPNPFDVWGDEKLTTGGSAGGKGILKMRRQRSPQGRYGVLHLVVVGIVSFFMGIVLCGHLCIRHMAHEGKLSGSTAPTSSSHAAFPSSKNLVEEGMVSETHVENDPRDAPASGGAGEGKGRKEGHGSVRGQGGVVSDSHEGAAAGGGFGRGERGEEKGRRNRNRQHKKGDGKRNPVVLQLSQGRQVSPTITSRTTIESGFGAGLRLRGSRSLTMCT
jgi:hypothetical protein